MSKRSRKGNTRPLALNEFRARALSGGEYDKFEYGGCGCMVNAAEEDEDAWDFAPSRGPRALARRFIEAPPLCLDFLE